jgi:hypothetical protein
MESEHPNALALNSQVACDLDHHSTSTTPVPIQAKYQTVPNLVWIASISHALGSFQSRLSHEAILQLPPQGMIPTLDDFSGKLDVSTFRQTDYLIEGWFHQHEASLDFQYCLSEQH